MISKNMAVKIDLKDKKILYELDRNSRMANSEIGKKVGLSPEAIMYRLKRFDKEGIITGYQPVINLSKLGIVMFKLCLSFQYLGEKELEKIILKIKEKDYVKWIVTVQGKWDLFVSIDVNNMFEIDKIKNEFYLILEIKLEIRQCLLLIKQVFFLVNIF